MTQQNVMPELATDEQYLSSIDEIVEEAANGRMFVLVDDEDRENEGDLVIPAQMATPEAINFMARYGRGLICLALTRDRVRELNLHPMSRRNDSPFATAFTESIEAKEGVTTGISASDRAHTIQVAIDSQSTAKDITTPGHVFPLEAREGGVLVRAGHTEAAVDIARLAGLNASGVICEIMNDDGSMARLPDLVGFCQQHNLKMASIADLIAYRRRHEQLVERILETDLDSRHGGTFRMMVYVNRVHYAEHIALVKGDIQNGEPVMVRMHAMNVLGDVLGDKHVAGGEDLHSAMRMVEEAGRGVVVLVREARPTSLSERVREHIGEPTAAKPLRDYGVGAQILLDLGVRNMILLTNSRRTIVGLDGFGLQVVDRQPIIHSA